MPRFLFVLAVLTAVLSPGATFAADRDYDPAVPTPEELLGFPVGSRPADPAQLQAAFRALAAASPRVALVPYGTSYEGRPLLYAVVGEPARIADLEALLAERRALADVADSGADPPLVVWIGACVHGNELSGSDAALALLHHLAADRGEETRKILARCVLLIDPLLNPDGRSRFLDHWQRWGAVLGSEDGQDLSHREGWPSARGNHYLLDLNRDLYALSQVESRGRVDVFLAWHPEVSFDLHEMGAFDTYLFSPPREPFNAQMPQSVHRWWETLSARMAAAFGERGWSCYSGDWNEEFNPNRGAAWPLHLGAVAYLGEQASSHGRSILRPDGLSLDYARSVELQFTAALNLIAGAAEHRAGLRADFLAARHDWPGEDAEGTRLYIVDPGRRPAQARRLAGLLIAQGLRLDLSRESFRLDDARNYWGELRGKHPFPAGSYLIDLAQPEGRLAAAVLEFDPRIGDVFLARERRLRESDGSGMLYEVSAWSLAMACGAEVYAAKRRVRAAQDPFDPAREQPGVLSGAEAPYGFLLDPREPGAELALAACFRAGIRCFGGTSPFRARGHDYPAGSILIKREGNAEDLPARLADIARDSGAGFQGLAHAFVEGGEDLGSRHFRPLLAPRIALIAGPPFYQTTFGALWHYLDRELGLPAARLRFSGLAGADLERYDLILVPDARAGRGGSLRSQLGEEGWDRLKDWIERGGTIVACGEGAGLLFGDGSETESPLGALRPRRQVLPELPAYLAEARRELSLAALSVDEEALRRGETGAIMRAAPVESTLAVAEDRDAWQRRFSPGGSILRANLDVDHWLSAGLGARIPVMVRTDMALLARRPAEIVGRFAPADSLRLSGLLWPEARERWAESVYLARERLGRGQAIVFLGNPVYRRTFHGSGRLLANALLLGPGMGTQLRPGR